MPNKSFSLWGFLRHVIGHELTRITVPIAMNEPITLLQRVAEQVQYCHLLEKADKESNPIDRLKFLSAFAITCLSSSYDRIRKPFNPLLSETYEMERNGVKIVCEQVSHHPPISAFYASSDTFTFSGTFALSAKFTGRFINVTNDGNLVVNLIHHHEVYAWNPHNTFVQVKNIIFGKVWLDYQGQLTVRNCMTNDTAKLNYIPTVPGTDNIHRVEGLVFDSR